MAPRIEELLAHVQKVTIRDSAFALKTCDLFLTEDRLVAISVGPKENFLVTALLDHTIGVIPVVVAEELIDRKILQGAELKNEGLSLDEMLRADKDNREIAYHTVRRKRLRPAFRNKGLLYVEFVQSGRNHHLISNLSKSDYLNLKAVLPKIPPLNDKLEIN